MLSFAEKHLSFYPNHVSACLIKRVENEICNSTSHKKKREREREEQEHNPTPKTFLKLLKISH